MAELTWHWNDLTSSKEELELFEEQSDKKIDDKIKYNAFKFHFDDRYQ